MLERFFIGKSFRLHISKPKKIPGNIFFDISKGKIFHKLRIQGRMHIFERNFQNDLNHVLDLDELIPLVFVIGKGAFCVELWSSEGSYRILVPMSYISCLDMKEH